MPFGLCNGPATFHRLMQLVLAGLKMLHCPVYVADVIVMGRSFREHFGNLQKVFEWLRKAGLTFKPTKCVFLHREVFCWDTLFPERESPWTQKKKTR